MGYTYCSHTECTNTSCFRHQRNATNKVFISIADLLGDCCYQHSNVDDCKESSIRRMALLAAICRGTQKTAYSCDDTCKALCGNDGTCVYCATIADAIEEVL